MCKAHCFCVTGSLNYGQRFFEVGLFYNCVQTHKKALNFYNITHRTEKLLEVWEKHQPYSILLHN